MTDWTAAVDIYCERTGPGLFAEPLNALSNLAFVAASVWGVRRSICDGAPASTLVLSVWVGAIGIGSALFHTVATRWAALADVLPIWSFMAAYVLVVLRRLFGLPWRAVAAVVAMALAVSALGAGLFIDSKDGVANGTGQYAPAFFALLAFAAAMTILDKPGARLAVAATVTFAVSLALRTADAPVCATIPVGTHFLWHLLNGTMLGLLLAVLLENGRRLRS